MAQFDRGLLRNRAVEGLLGLGALVSDRPREALGEARDRLVSVLPHAAVVIGLASLLLLMQTSAIAAEGYTLRRLEAERESWRQRNLQLESEIAALQSLQRVDLIARQRLGMVPATERTYINVNVVPSGPEIPDDLPPSWARQAGLPQRDESVWGRLRETLNVLPWFQEQAAPRPPGGVR
jgi:cell division protein FtsB